MHSPTLQVRHDGMLPYSHCTTHAIQVLLDLAQKFFPDVILDRVPTTGKDNQLTPQYKAAGMLSVSLR